MKPTRKVENTMYKLALNDTTLEKTHSPHYLKIKPIIEKATQITTNKIRNFRKRIYCHHAKKGKHHGGTKI